MDIAATAVKRIDELQTARDELTKQLLAKEGRCSELEDVLAGIRGILTRDDDLRSLDVRDAVERLLIQRECAREDRDALKLEVKRLEGEVGRLELELMEMRMTLAQLVE